jgi:nitroreductase
MAGALLLLAAQAQGLGACWVCAPLFAPQVVRETLGLPEGWEAQGAVLLGYPAEEGEKKSRCSLEEVAVWF